MNSNSSSTCPVPIIAVDGPSGAGKGTICRLLAQATGFLLLDSGALYRLTGLAAQQKGVDVNDEAAVAEVARTLDVDFIAQGDSTLVCLAGRDVTEAIRTEQAGMNASVVAAHPRVRTALLDRQRAFARPPGLVADGRDMGTVIFPAAQLKVFLTASAEERARRRLLQLQEAGEQAEFTALLQDIQERDLRDSSRTVAPLRPAQDAFVLDSTELCVDEVKQRILALFQAKILASR